MRNPILAGIALGAMLLAEGPINQAAAIFVRTPPPRPRSAAVVGVRPGPGYVWTSGYYRWGRGRRGRGRYVWMPGRWRRPPRSGAIWVAPRWRRGPGGYTFVAGRWR
jgi:WXXGXW repeat (2 copies)